MLRLQLLLRRLDAAGQLERGVRAVAGRWPGCARWAAAGCRGPPACPHRPGRSSCPRFAVVRVADGYLIAQAPRSHTVVELSPEAGCLLGALARWTTPAELSTAEASTAEASTAEASTGVPGLPAGTVTAILPLLADAGLLAPGGPEADTETTTLAQAQWSVPDLWLHSRSRGPLLNAAYGGAYPMADRFPPLPARQNRTLDPTTSRARQHRARQHRAGHRPQYPARRSRRGQGPAAERGAGTAPVHPRARRLRAAHRRSARRAAVPDNADPVHLHHLRRAGSGRPSVPVRRRGARA